MTLEKAPDVIWAAALLKREKWRQASKWREETKTLNNLYGGGCFQAYLNSKYKGFFFVVRGCQGQMFV